LMKGLTGSVVAIKLSSLRFEPVITSYNLLRYLFDRQAGSIPAIPFLYHRQNSLKLDGQFENVGIRYSLNVPIPEERTMINCNKN
ncbi:MAG: hypothetical protein U1E11_01700, partial [Dethiobacteria bacterium]|nr:hypothetical protein [Dethiobacteria bacterium]